MGEALRAELSTHGIPQQQALKRNGIHVDWTGRYALHLAVKAMNLLLAADTA